MMSLLPPLEFCGQLLSLVTLPLDMVLIHLRPMASDFGDGDKSRAQGSVIYYV